MPTSKRARQALTDATVIAAEIDAALQALDAALGGYPTSTAGASPITAGPSVPCLAAGCERLRPCPDHDVALNPVERLALTTDPASAALDSLANHVRLMAHHARAAAFVVHRWAHQGVDASTVRDRLTAIDAEIWCRNCVQYGERNPREEGRNECSFCRSFRTTYKRPANRAIWDAKNARGGRIDVGTIERILRQDGKGKARTKR